MPDADKLTAAEWADSQRNELWYWKTQFDAGNPEQFNRRNYYLAMFKDFLDHAGLAAKVLMDVGSGPEGILHALPGKVKLALDPLMNGYRNLGFKVEANGVSAFNVAGESLTGFGGDRPDIIFCLNALDHVQHPQRVVDEMTRILAPDGVLVLCVDMRPQRLCDCYHKLPLTEAMLRAMLPAYEFEARIVPHGGGNPINQFVAVCYKRGEIYG